MRVRGTREINEIEDVATKNKSSGRRPGERREGKEASPTWTEKDRGHWDLVYGLGLVS